MPKTATLYGDTGDVKSAKGRRPKILPNPLPDTIDALTILAATTPYLANVVYKIIALWVQRENAKFIRIEVSEIKHEVETRGGVSGKEVERAFSHIRKLVKKADKANLKVILPPGIDRSLPEDIVKAAAKKKGGKK